MKTLHEERLERWAAQPKAPPRESITCRRDPPVVAGAYCLQCGDPIPIYAKDYKYPDGSILKQTGHYRGSGSMRVLDPDHYFCTMRCAVRYAVKVAERHHKRALLRKKGESL